MWEKRSFTYKKSLVGHTGSILALEYAEEKKWLLSSSGLFYHSWCHRELIRRIQEIALSECVSH